MALGSVCYKNSSIMLSQITKQLKEQCESLLKILEELPEAVAFEPIRKITPVPGDSRDTPQILERFYLFKLSQRNFSTLRGLQRCPETLKHFYYPEVAQDLGGVPGFSRVQRQGDFADAKMSI
ncbi:hypothetical protein EV360DRAFT_66494 [Lentinula raphanica]|nr:hypothetical protein EV360DRAFT_66494 [Lentinula raphanica]